MKTKKLILAIAIFGGVLFSAQAAITDSNEQFKSEVRKDTPKPPNG